MQCKETKKRNKMMTMKKKKEQTKWTTDKIITITRISVCGYASHILHFTFYINSIFIKYMLLLFMLESHRGGERERERVITIYKKKDNQNGKRSTQCTRYLYLCTVHIIQNIYGICRTTN